MAREAKLFLKPAQNVRVPVGYPQPGERCNAGHAAAQERCRILKNASTVAEIRWWIVPIAAGQARYSFYLSIIFAWYSTGNDIPGGWPLFKRQVRF